MLNLERIAMTYLVAADLPPDVYNAAVPEFLTRDVRDDARAGLAEPTAA